MLCGALQDIGLISRILMKVDSTKSAYFEMHANLQALLFLVQANYREEICYCRELLSVRTRITPDILHNNCVEPFIIPYLCYYFSGWTSKLLSRCRVSYSG
jgi:hypothetical protein